MVVLADGDAGDLSAQLEVVAELRVVRAPVHVLDEDAALIWVICVRLLARLADVFLGANQLALLFFAYLVENHPSMFDLFKRAITYPLQSPARAS